jgi:gamma-glutamyl-gamma-aminobutyrate hydrolase PuuD
LKKILVLNGSSYGAAVRGLGVITEDAKSFVEAPEDFGLVLFTGGEDISPAAYGDTSPRRVCITNAHRDAEEFAIARLALRYGIPMAGICRGVQLLNVFGKGTMIHHLDGHSGSHHDMYFPPLNRSIRVNSLHHQMCLPGPDGLVVGYTKGHLSDIYIGRNDEVVHYMGEENEAFVFPDIKAFGVQYHPEFMAAETEGYIFFWEMCRRGMTMNFRDFYRAYTGEDKQNEAFYIPDRCNTREVAV